MSMFSSRGSLERLSIYELKSGGVEQAIDPRQELLGAVVYVQNDGHPVLFCKDPSVKGAGDDTNDGRPEAGSRQRRTIMTGASA